MNILFIAYNFTPTQGGVQRVTDILTKEFLKRGHNVSFLCGCNKADGESYNTATDIYYMDKSLNDRLDYNSQMLYQSILRKLNIEVIIMQYPMRKRSLFFLENASKNILRLSVIHTQPFPKVNGHFVFFNNNKIKNLIFSVIFLLRHYLQNHIQIKLYSEFTNLSDKVCLLSMEYKRRFLNFVDADENKVIAIGNPNTFEVTKYTTNKKNIILFVGRLGYPKNAINFLNVWKLLSKKNRDWSAYIVGDGCDMGFLKEYAAKKRIERLHFEGQQSDVSKYYEEAKILCMTSLFEGWPMVLIEAMSYGCVPVCYSSFEALYDIVDDGKSGLLCKPFIVQDMVTKVQSLIEDKNKLDCQSMAAIQKVRVFHVSSIVDKWEAVFKEFNLE